VHNSPLILVDPYGLWAEFSAYPSITDPCGHDSSSSLPFSCQPSNYSNGPADSPGASGSGAGFCIEMNLVPEGHLQTPEQALQAVMLMLNNISS
jgi:hypothetical protein